jgi:hypothetical protein
MSRVVHFEIAVDDPERAAEFYKSVFGWDIAKWQGPIDYWMATTGSPEAMGIDGAIMPRGDMSRGTYNTIGVANLNEAMSKVQAAGGRVVTRPDIIPGVGLFAYCADPEGNVFGILQPEDTLGPTTG